jgi:hypothetical protein
MGDPNPSDPPPPLRCLIAYVSMKGLPMHIRFIHATDLERQLREGWTLICFDPADEDRHDSWVQSHS